MSTIYNVFSSCDPHPFFVHLHRNLRLLDEVLWQSAKGLYRHCKALPYLNWAGFDFRLTPYFILVGIDLMAIEFNWKWKKIRTPKQRNGSFVINRLYWRWQWPFFGVKAELLSWKKKIIIRKEENTKKLQPFKTILQLSHVSQDYKL